MSEANETWISEPPTRPGLYWLLRANDPRPTIVELTDGRAFGTRFVKRPGCPGLETVRDDGNLWCGPVVAPPGLRAAARTVGACPRICENPSAAQAVEVPEPCE